MGVTKDINEYEQKLDEARRPLLKKYWWVFLIIVLAFIVIYAIIALRK